MALEVTENEEPVHITRNDLASGRWVDIVLKKVQDYGNCKVENTKVKMYCSIHHDLAFIDTTCSEASKLTTQSVTELNTLRSQMEQQNNDVLYLHDKVFAYDELLIEKNNLEVMVADQQKILDTWSKASVLSNEVIVDQIPYQAKRILEGKIKTAALTPKLFELENDVKKMNTIPVSQNFSYDYSKQKEKQNLTYSTSTEVEDGVYGPSPSSDVSILGQPPLPKEHEKTKLSRRAKKTLRKENVQNNDSRSNRSEVGQCSKVVPEVILRMEKQIQLLTRQFQSCNAKLHWNYGVATTSKASPKQQKQATKSKFFLLEQTLKKDKIPKTVQKVPRRQTKKAPTFVSPVETLVPPVAEQVVTQIVPPSSDPNFLVFGSFTTDQVTQNPSSDGFYKRN